MKADYIIISEPPIIKQNKKTNFIFKKNESGGAVEVFFKHKEEIMLENLYLIIKSYTAENEIILLGIGILAKENINDNGSFDQNLFHFLNPKMLQLFSFFEFKIGFSQLIENDYEYVKSLDFYAFRFLIAKTSKGWVEKKIFPAYPGNSAFKNIHIPIKKKNYEKGLLKKSKKLYNEGMLFKKKQTK